MASQEQAHAAGNTEISIAHLVLGLLTEPDSLAAKAIIAQGVPLERVREAAAATLPAAADQVPELIPYDAQGKKALELTFREALRLGHNAIGTEHILLALLEFENGSGVLCDLGISKDTAEQAIVVAVDAARAPTRSCRNDRYAAGTLRSVRGPSRGAVGSSAVRSKWQFTRPRRSPAGRRCAGPGRPRHPLVGWVSVGICLGAARGGG
jgi:ATP-dependent Clp protease ATP-binding subunit ClpA